MKKDTNKDWEKRFDEICPTKLEIGPINGNIENQILTCDLVPQMKKVKSFISQEIHQAEKRGREEIKQLVIEDVPHKYQERILQAIKALQQDQLKQPK